MGVSQWRGGNGPLKNVDAKVVDGAGEMRLNQVTLPVVDMAESIAFYKRLGLIQIVDAPHYARFECPEGESTFSLHKAEGGVKPSEVVVYFETANLDAEVERLKSLGVVFDQDPQDEVWLWREARLKDPAGNRLCLFWAGEARKNPPWRLPASASA